MAAPRVEIPEVVLSGGQPVTGASVQVNNRGAGSATVFAAEAGGTTAANPIITDSNGRIEGWLEEGSYDLVVSATGLTTYTQPYEAVRGNNSPGRLATATGDLVYASSANNIARLGIGASGNVLTVSNGVPAWGSGTVTYRKTTAKTVNTTVSATDLLNGEITVAAGVMGTTGLLRLTCWGDWLQNSGGASSIMRFQLVLGGTTLLDTNTSGGAAIGASATRGSWKIAAEIMNLGSASSQLSSLEFRVNTPGFASTANNPFLTGEGNFEAVSNSVNAQMVLGHGVNTTAVDTGTSKTLVLNVINASSSASYETKLFGALVEIV